MFHILKLIVDDSKPGASHLMSMVHRSLRDCVSSIESHSSDSREASHQVRRIAYEEGAS